MGKKVLSVGQCVPDHRALCGLLEGRFGAEVVPVALPAEALEKLRAESFNLVVVNRKLDADYSDGLAVIRQIKANAQLAAVPCMLITNYPESQQEAVAAGALEGFGKLEYHKPETHAKLAALLGPATKEG